MNAGRILRDAGYDTELIHATLHPVDTDLVRVLPASRLIRKLWGEGIQGMTVVRWVLVDPSLLDSPGDGLASLLVHELVHVRQWSDFGFFGFLRRYIADYLRGRRQGLDHRSAYKWNRLEVEARAIAETLRS